MFVIINCVTQISLLHLMSFKSCIVIHAIARIQFIENRVSSIIYYMYYNNYGTITLMLYLRN